MLIGTFILISSLTAPLVFRLVAEPDRPDEAFVEQVVDLVARAVST